MTRGLVPHRYALLRTGEVRPHPENPNRGDVGAIGESIDATGFWGALLVQESTGRILAGEHRWKAAKARGLEELPALVLDVDDDTARRILLADNAYAAMGVMDPGALVSLLGELSLEPGALTGTGYTAEDLAKLLAVRPSTDEAYTPAWVFDAAGLVFGMDVCAPADPAWRRCPAKRYLTADDDGLAVEWDGTVWMNPPYSGPAPWVSRFVAHGDGLALLPALRGTPWAAELLGAADAVALLSVEFDRPAGGTEGGSGPCVSILAAMGEDAAGGCARVAAADRYCRGAVFRRWDRG